MSRRRIRRGVESVSLILWHIRWFGFCVNKHLHSVGVLQEINIFWGVKTRTIYPYYRIGGF
jgi:hypothetical protein